MLRAAKAETQPPGRQRYGARCCYSFVPSVQPTAGHHVHTTRGNGVAVGGYRASVIIEVG